MATKVHMEALSPTMEEGQIVRWLKSEGDVVANGDILAEIETDKATMELVARGDGILRRILLQAGSAAPIGEVIGVIASADEDISAIVGAGGSGDSEPAAAPAEAASAAAPAEPSAPVAQAPQAPPAEVSGAQETGGRVKASPLARKLAEEAGLDLSIVAGSGPGGRVVKRDVEEARSAGGAPAAGAAQGSVQATAPGAPAAGRASAAPAPQPWSDAGATEGFDALNVSQMRKTIARRLTESLSPVPHFFLTVEIDMARVQSARASVNELLAGSGDKVSVNDFVLKATAAALAKHPECNSAWHDDHIRRFHHVHIGVAVAVDDGLITPVVKHADRKGIVQISREVREMAGRAREKRLSPDEYTGSTFSVSNLGMFGIREFTAIINPPEAGILAVGAVEEIPAVVEGRVEVRPRMRITMSCDHRVIDGAQGSRFLQTLKGMLEEPAAMLL
jgi:pyruvate dehydrogenase E2 component (dihydrolipoamide acetyltransferase)